MVILGLGTGGIKANVTPFCAEQYQKVHAYVKTLKSGERVIVDPDLTVERMFMWYDGRCISEDLYLTHLQVLLGCESWCSLALDYRQC